MLMLNDDDDSGGGGGGGGDSLRFIYISDDIGGLSQEKVGSYT